MLTALFLLVGRGSLFAQDTLSRASKTIDSMSVRMPDSTLSAGDSGKVKKAKDTILYGIIGLIIALLAFAIVNFVIAKVTGS